MAALPAEPIQGPSEKRLRLATGLIVASVRFHDLDRFGRAPITDVHSPCEYPQRAGY
jgi:hypothetical protein